MSDIPKVVADTVAHHIALQVRHNEEHEQACLDHDEALALEESLDLIP